MNIIVCVKQVIDPEAPPSSFTIDAGSKTAQMRGASPVIDPFAEHAVEAALKIKDAVGASITLISLGDRLQRDVVKKPLAMGGDNLILCEDPSFANTSSNRTAAILAAAIEKVGDYGLILCGREASDTNAGQTGSGIAELLGLPCITLARKIEVNGDNLRVERATADGYDIIESSLPAVVTVSNEIGEPRYPTIKGIMAAKKMQPEVWTAADIAASDTVTGPDLDKLYQPVFEGSCEFVEAETPEETGALLASKLREAKIL